LSFEEIYIGLKEVKRKEERVKRGIFGAISLSHLIFFFNCFIRFLAYYFEERKMDGIGFAKVCFEVVFKSLEEVSISIYESSWPFDS
jgi:hypothetical protein